MAAYVIYPTEEQETLMKAFLEASAVMTAIRKYHKVLSLPPGNYTIGLHYILSEERKKDSQVIPFDKSGIRTFYLKQT